jgi:hypothetical protein
MHICAGGCWAAGVDDGLVLMMDWCGSIELCSCVCSAVARWLLAHVAALLHGMHGI